MAAESTPPTLSYVKLRRQWRSCEHTLLTEAIPGRQVGRRGRLMPFANLDKYAQLSHSAASEHREREDAGSADGLGVYEAERTVRNSSAYARTIIHRDKAAPHRSLLSAPYATIISHTGKQPAHASRRRRP